MMINRRLSLLPALSGLAAVALVAAGPAHADAERLTAELGLDEVQLAQRVCPQIYRPVCATRRGVRRTYSNSCMARRAGARVIRQGRCRTRNRDRNRACPRIYRPVCGVRRGSRQTYANACMARRSGARVVHQGQCRTRSRACPRIYRPVCGVRRGVRRTYPNSCVAQRSRARIIHRGQCRGR